MSKVPYLVCAMKMSLTLIAVNFLALSSFAMNYFVDPSGSDANSCLSAGVSACKTIQAAINKSTNFDFISIAAGTYAEAVVVDDRNGLTVTGAGPGITKIVPPAGPSVPNQPLVVIDSSKRILFQNMSLSGAGGSTEGFRIFYSTAITVSNCTVEGHQGAGGGFFIAGSAGTNINAIIQDNGIGIRIDSNSDAALNSPPFAASNSVVRRNGIGVQVRGGDFFFHGTGSIESNDTGILMDGGSMKACCEDQTVPRKISSNVTGMLIRSGSSVELNGPMEFAGNEAFAIRQFGSGSTIRGKITFQTNGSVNTPAIILTGGQMTLAGGLAPNNIVIKDNPGTGVFLTDAASLRMQNVTVTNNGVHGVRVQALSVAALIQNIVMNNNSGRDLSCAPNAFARGTNSAVDTQYCPGFDNSPDPNSP